MSRIAFICCIVLLFSCCLLKTSANNVHVSVNVDEDNHHNHHHGNEHENFMMPGDMSLDEAATPTTSQDVDPNSRSAVSRFAAKLFNPITKSQHFALIKSLLHVASSCVHSVGSAASTCQTMGSQLKAAYEEYKQKKDINKLVQAASTIITTPHGDKPKTPIINIVNDVVIGTGLVAATLLIILALILSAPGAAVGAGMMAILVPVFGALAAHAAGAVLLLDALYALVAKVMLHH